ncbi:NAD(P)/FAD-dependent oxidoreductase [Niveispirillum fermenti]|uniref:NAD(P)/FAD-dependent oxidoreductase n=1 Tax=Niveispirillum fermenti TaxID=1233113 RepID=UPI003A88E30A
MESVDALVIGAGPAGCAAALNLAPVRRVLLIDRRADCPPRIGESLPAAAGRLLADMGLLPAFLAERHAPCHGQRSLWGGPEPVERDALRDPYGHGWHLDRARFDGWLRDVARCRGAALSIPDELAGLERDGDGWRVRLAGGRIVQARVLIDAGGRAAPLARRLGVMPRPLDRLACAWAHLPDTGAAPGLTSIVAEPDGWWYSAPLPGGQRVLAFHTDADLDAAGSVHDRVGLLWRAAGVKALAPLLPQGAVPAGPGGFTAAHGSVLDPPAGPGWFACGDAAGAFDPLSAQGLFNALYTGLAAAEGADRALAGDRAGAAGTHTGRLNDIRAAYRAHLTAFYGLERRWAGRPFWARRPDRG